MKNSNLSTMISALPSDAQAGAPLYAQVKQAVLDALSHGEWKQGEAIPPEKLLAERFGASARCARPSMNSLPKTYWCGNRVAARTWRSTTAIITSSSSSGWWARMA
jgi:DNA-binding FadR family transcriptional regulator